MRLPEALGHLTYCTNVHPGESLREVRRTLVEHVAAVRQRVAASVPFGVGLRLSARAAQELEQAQSLASFRALLTELELYVFTLNGFPYGSFHGGVIKERVYLPDWRSSERAVYTLRLARILAALLPEDLAYGSISTVPVGFAEVVQQRDLPHVVASLARLVASLVMLERSTGRRIVVALEPEPCCLLETCEQTARFFEQRVFETESAKLLASELGVSVREGHEALRRHLGVCLDLCHAAVEYEVLEDCLQAFAGAGVEIAKLQISSGLALDPRDGEARRRLVAFREATYLHQVVARRGEGLVRYRDLDEAERNASSSESEWRVHFHVPIFQREIPYLRTTQDFVKQALALHKRRPISAHLEVETYTWDVLPSALRASSVADCVASELRWVREELGA